MTLRQAVLTAAGLGVLGLGIYLFLEVRAAPATAEVPTKRPAATRETEPAPSSSDDTASEQPAAPRREARIAPPVRDVTSSGTGTPAPQVPADPADARLVNLDKDSIMSEANKAYDRGEFDEAQTIAQKVLNEDPKNIRMLRIMVSASCIDGDSVLAQKHYLMLPAADREQMRTRCSRYGVSFNEQ